MVTTSIAEAYQEAFNFFNDELFDNELPDVNLTMNEKRRGVLGYFAPERWSAVDNKDSVISEISLDPHAPLARQPVEYYSTLVHEMVHLWQHIKGKPSSRGYHNREWADKMDSIGLIASNTGEPGGNRTGVQMTHYIEENGYYKQAFDKMPEHLKLPFGKLPVLIMKKKYSSSNKVKYSSSDPECDTVVWGKPGLLIKCDKTGIQLEPELKDGD